MTENVKRRNRNCSHDNRAHYGFIEKIVNDVKRIYKNDDIKFKNAKPEKSKAYEPTELEHLLNIISHGILILPSFYGSLLLLHKSQTSKEHVVVSLVYGSALVLLFSVSFLYHCVFYLNSNLVLKDLLHRMDRAMIYIFIAGSYYPWLILERFKYNFVVDILKYLIWILAALGIIYQQIFHERYKQIETIFYVLIAFLPATLVIFFGHEFRGMLELKTGGLIYMIGVVFFKCDGKICCAHAIWHVFVVLAAIIHYLAILKYLFSDQNIHEHMTHL